MIHTLYTLTFQGEPTADGVIPAADLPTVLRASFPRLPPRDATMDREYRSFTVTPLESRRLLVATGMNRGDVDRMGRPVLRANGCILEVRGLRGALRDLVALWTALEGWVPGESMKDFLGAVCDASPVTSPERYAVLVDSLRRDPSQVAAVASVVASPRGVLHVGRSPLPDAVHAGLLLLPLGRLATLQMAMNADFDEMSEAHVVTRASAPAAQPPPPVGLLGRFLPGRGAPPPPPSAVHVELGRVVNSAPASTALVEAIVDPRPWGGLGDMARLGVLLDVADAPEVRGAATTPFDLVPELAELRRVVRAIEALGRGAS